MEGCGRMTEKKLVEEVVGIRKLKCPSCGHMWEVSPGSYWTNCPKCREPLEIEKVVVNVR